MMNDTDATRQQLELIADTFGQLRHVDVARARARGRRILRVRRASAAAGSAAVVSLVAVAATGLSSPNSAPSVPAAATTTGSDPLVQTVSFGWLPTGLVANGYVADHQGQPYFQVVAQAAGTARSPAVFLTDYGRGQAPILPHLPGGVLATRIPARPVNGHPAYWLTEPTAGPQAQINFELQWRYAPHSWADLQAAGLPTTSIPALTRTVYKIADTVTLGLKIPVRMPLRVTGIPGGLTPDTASLITGSQLTALLGYSATTPSDSLQIAVTRTGKIPHHPGSPPTPAPTPNSTRWHKPPMSISTNTVIDGHPAYDSQLDTPHAASAELVVFAVRGLDVAINASGHILKVLQRSGGLAGLFRRMTVYGSNPANWTITPTS